MGRLYLPQFIEALSILGVYARCMENATAAVLSPEDLHEIYHGFKHQIWALGANVIIGWRPVPFALQVLYLPSIVLKKAAKTYPQLLDPARFIDSDRMLARLTKVGCTVVEIPLHVDLPDGPEVIRQINDITRRGALDPKPSTPAKPKPKIELAPEPVFEPPAPKPNPEPVVEAASPCPPLEPAPVQQTPQPEPVWHSPAVEPAQPSPQPAPEPAQAEIVPPPAPAKVHRAPLLAAILGRRAKPAAKQGGTSDIILGVDSGDGAEIAWNLSVRANPGFRSR